MFEGTGSLVLEMLLALTWFACIGLLISQLRDRHPDRYSQMGFDQVQGLGRGAHQPFVALLRFLLTGEYRRIGDAQIARLGSAMLVVGATFLVIFLVGFFEIAL